MPSENFSRFSIAARGPRQQLIIGIALVSIIPILSIWIIKTSASDEIQSIRDLLISGLVVIAGIAGYALLKHSPDNVARLRHEIEDTTREKCENAIDQSDEDNDILVIRNCTELLVDEMQTRVQGLEFKKTRLEQNLSRARKMEGIASMASGMSHDLTNIFTAVLGNTNLALRKMKPDDPSHAYLQHIETATLRALEMINSIRVSAGQGSFTAEKFNVSSFIETISSSLRNSVPTNVNIKYNLSADMPIIAADSEHINTVITSLITNAANAIQDKQGTITLSTGKTYCDRSYLSRGYIDENLPEGQYVYIEVCNDGPGITPDVLEKIFDPFFTTRIRGQGLGLSVAMGIIRTHSGAIIVTTAPDSKSTSFSVLLPCDATRQLLPPAQGMQTTLTS